MNRINSSIVNKSVKALLIVCFCAQVRAADTNKILIVATANKVGLMTKCVVETKARQSFEVFIENLPAETERYWADRKAAEQRVAQLKQFISTESRRLTFMQGEPMDSMSPAYLQFRRDEANLAIRRQDLSEATMHLRELIEQNISKIGFQGVFTGKTYSGLQIWRLEK